MRKLVVLLALVVLACRAEQGETGEPDDFGRMQLLLSVVDQQKGDVRVTIKNLTNRPLVVCRENWALPTGLIRFHIFRAGEEKEVQLSSTAFQGLSEVNEKDHLVELPPLGSVSGVMNLQLPSQYGITKGELDVDATYFCPFQGPRIERAAHRSNRVHVTLR
jgi:hypothetical protein